MILQICSLVQEYFMDFADSSSSSNTKTSNQNDVKNETFLSLTEIDHMRDRKNYLKILTQWANELNVFGRVLFCKKSRRIFLLICSNDENSLKEFHVRHRTQVLHVLNEKKK
jgi:hypothetical protein